MHSVASFPYPLNHTGLDTGSSPYSMNLQIGQDDRGRAQKIYASCRDSTYHSVRHKADSMAGLSKGPPFPQWSGSSPLSTLSDDFLSCIGTEDSLDPSPFSWPYESSYFCGAPTFPRADTDFARPLPHSIPNATAVPDLSGFPLLSGQDDFSNAFDLDFTVQSPPVLSSRSSTSAPSSCSSSPSYLTMDVTDTTSLKSREASPTRIESDQRRRFPCLIAGCPRRFTSQYTLKVHVEAHKPKPRTSFPCTLGCSERFSRQHDRLRHEVAKHGKVCEFLCDECGRFFSTKKTLGNHKCPVAQGGTRWVNS